MRRRSVYPVAVRIRVFSFVRGTSGQSLSTNRTMFAGELYCDMQIAAAENPSCPVGATESNSQQLHSLRAFPAHDVSSFSPNLDAHAVAGARMDGGHGKCVVGRPYTDPFFLFCVHSLHSNQHRAVVFVGILADLDRYVQKRISPKVRII